APLALQNGQFDADTSGWTASFGATVARSASDAANNSRSGSLDLTLGAGDPTLAVEVAAAQCISAAAGASYTASAQIFIASGASTTGALGIWFYGSADCSGAIAGMIPAQFSTTGGWSAVRATGAAPADARSMSVRLEAIKPIGQTSAEALFDAVAVSSP
ncbi:MAG TPA: hypothetical protein VHO06_13530, partial [Polyangia bacterium]|nr:hypothetical protein [Polyangia bacterium]